MHSMPRETVRVPGEALRGRRTHSDTPASCAKESESEREGERE
ncbi:hypothetical protein E2C01_099141 [Portunus trituberculatus]|uniref:Uncharacterized protein n=1 Tax=Portunus trituberculatus TaxID=210409 RepID=A0A5B7K327_PORTR|nr:hypothetical protein [Portunus trituberculatus]